MVDYAKSIVRGAVGCIAGWVGFILSVVLFCRLDFGRIPWPLAKVFGTAMLVLVFALALLSLYLTLVRPFVGCFRLWNGGHQVLAVSLVMTTVLILTCLYHACHWSRVPSYDSASSDGRYKIVVYMTNYDIWYFLPGGPGDALCHEARVDLVETETGKVLGSERGMWLSHVSEITWYADHVDVGRTAASFDLPSEPFPSQNKE